MRPHFFGQERDRESFEIFPTAAMSWCKEAIIAAINLCSRPFSCLPLKNQHEKGSSEVEKMDMRSEMLPEKFEKMDMWSEMLPDILEDISDRLPLRDFVAFRGVCRKWRSAPSGRSEITSFSKERPWLMFYEFDRKSGVAEDTCYLYNRPHPNCCDIRLSHLRGARIMHSKAGWLFTRSQDGHLFLYNAFTLTKIDLPKHIVAEEQVCTMTTPTPKNNCTVFILSRRTDLALEISWCRIGDTEWKSDTAEISKDQIGTMLAAYGCDCTGSHKPKACAVATENENTIHIAGSERSLLYDYMNKRCVREWSRAPAGKPFFWEEHMDSPVHHKNWLERFGEKGISISTCAISKKTDVCIGTSGCYRNIAGESGSTVEYKLVRASWIEPRFG